MDEKRTVCKGRWAWAGHPASSPRFLGLYNPVDSWPQFDDPGVCWIVQVETCSVLKIGQVSKHCFSLLLFLSGDLTAHQSASSHSSSVPWLRTYAVNHGWAIQAAPVGRAHCQVLRCRKRSWELLHSTPKANFSVEEEKQDYTITPFAISNFKKKMPQEACV